jgi:hypothetical protein
MSLIINHDVFNHQSFSVAHVAKGLWWSWWKYGGVE